MCENRFCRAPKYFFIFFPSTTPGVFHNVHIEGIESFFLAITLYWEAFLTMCPSFKVCTTFSRLQLKGNSCSTWSYILDMSADIDPPWIGQRLNSCKHISICNHFVMFFWIERIYFLCDKIKVKLIFKVEELYKSWYNISLSSIIWITH